MIETGAAGRPKPGEPVSGDGWLVHDLGDQRVLLAIVDGLGHGPEAAVATQAAVAELGRLLEEPSAAEDLERLLRGMHGVLRPTRGAVAGLACVAAHSGDITYVGVGNTEARIVGSGAARLFSRDGLLGGPRLPRPQLQRAHLEPGDLLLLHTDGLLLTEPLAVVGRPPCQELAERLLEQAQERDDAAVVVARRSSTS